MMKSELFQYYPDRSTPMLESTLFICRRGSALSHSILNRCDFRNRRKPFGKTLLYPSLHLCFFLLLSVWNAIFTHTLLLSLRKGSGFRQFLGWMHPLGTFLMDHLCLRFCYYEFPHKMAERSKLELLLRGRVKGPEPVQYQSVPFPLYLIQHQSKDLTFLSCIFDKNS